MVDDLTYDLNFNLALKACYDKGLPAFLPKAQNKSEVVDKIVAYTNGIEIDDDQKQRIASLPSYRWAKDGYDDVIKNIKDLPDTISEYQSSLSDPKKQKDIYKKEVQALRKLPSIER